MVTRLRFIRGLVKESANLRKELRNSKLKDDERAVIERMLSQNEQLIVDYKGEVMPYVKKLSDDNMLRFVEEYYFSSKSCSDAEANISYPLSADNVRRDIERKLTKFWTL